MPIILNVSHVSLVEHDAPHRRVRSIHGRAGQGEWQHTQEQAIEYIQSGLFSYFLIHDARVVQLVVGRTTEGGKFLKAEPDGATPGLLLQLPAISPPANQPPSL